MRKTIVVGMSSCNIAAGAEKVYGIIREKMADGLDVNLSITGCLGLCFCEPQVRVIDEDGSEHLYVDVTPERITGIIDEHLKGGRPIAAWASDLNQGAMVKLLGKQRRIVLANCGRINPERIDDYLAQGGYQALERVLRENRPAAVIDEVLASGLRGRGGGGFSTGLKWRFAYNNKADKKFVICNADEGDPGAFMDRTVLESDPHAVLEGMAIGAFATGADEAYIYCRAEYPLAVKRLDLAIAQARERGLLGKSILGTPFSFDIHVKEGAGAFVCGEETALMASIEGRRGMPRIRPPFPAEAGLLGKPTTINNVETWANIPWIIRHGAADFAAQGTEKSKGSKVFALAGKIKRGGLVEVPMGITLDEIIHDIGGGTGSKRQVKAVQMGGPSGGCVPRQLFDTRIDYDEVVKTGAIMGSGGMVVMDETTCMVDVARYFLNFTQLESCGKCTFCRIGTTRMLEILTRICHGRGKPEDIPMLEDLADQIKHTSLCGLGQTAPNPVLTTLRYFRDEYEEHIHEKRCRAGKCRDLCSFEITDRCVGCTLCARNCPVNCIAGASKELHVIDQNRCIRCGVCRDVCPFDAVAVR
ncbi:MAG: NADH-quinone oxidoreductase subunit NuoF [Desulfuromonadaceae bacterium]|nr:NADH-quinone oxidoreductase subunit NuoF [Desulfuromonadaceae bacterium]